MNRYLIICDKLMYGALLAMIFFLPYSLALIEACQVTMMVAWVVRQCCRPQKVTFFSSGMGRSLIAIALLIAVTVPLSHYPALSLKKFGTRFLQQIFLMYLVTETVYSRKRLYGVLLVLLLTLFFVSVDVMAQYTWGKSIIYHTSLIFGRVTGPMNHPNDLGTLLVTVLPVVLVSFIIYRKKMPWAGRAMISLLFLFLVIALGLTDSRGAWIAFAVSMIVLGFCFKNYKVVMSILLMLAVFFGVFGILCLRTRTDIYSAPMMHGSNVLELFFTPDGRESYWRTAAGVIRHYPWFGCGYSAYVQTLRDLHVGHEEYPHNSILQITAELGFLGLILYGWFFTSLCLQMKNVLRVVSRERDLFLLGCAISAGILAWVIHSLMDTVWASLQLSVLWWIFIGILLSLRLIKEGEKTCL